MTVILSKMSLPDVWSKQFNCLSDAVDELRLHQCGLCLDGRETGVPLDFDLPGGGRYECRDAELLLSTGCGLEYEMTGDHGLWSVGDDLDPEMGRHSRRKATTAQVMNEWLPTATGAVWQW